MALKITGRVIDRVSRRAVAGSPVELWGGAEPRLLDETSTDANGRFQFTLAPREIRGTFGNTAPSGYFRVKTGRGEPLKVGTWFAGEDREPDGIDLEIDLAAPDRSTLIEDVDLPIRGRDRNKLLAVLRAADVTTLADVRAFGIDVQDADSAATGAAAESLKAQARLATIGSDPAINATLAAAGVNSISALSSGSIAEIAERSGLKREILQPLQRKAKAFGSFSRMALADAVIGASPVNRAYRFNDLIGPGWLRPVRPAVPDPDACQTCSDCASAISPAAYLVDLLDFLIDNFAVVTVTSASTVTPRGFADLAAIEGRFRRPFGSLIVDCEEANVQVRQIEVAIEVLEKFVTSPPVTGYSRDLVFGWFDLLDVRNRPVYPKPDVLQRMFDAYLAELNIKRTDFDSAVALAYPSAGGAADSTALDDLLSPLGVTTAFVQTGLGLKAGWKPTIKALDWIPQLVRAARTSGIDPNDVLQVSAYADAIANASAAVGRVKDYALPDIRENLIAFALRELARAANPELPFKTARQLGDYLHIDLANDVCARTTRLGSAIETIQSWVDAFRGGREDPGYLLMVSGGTETGNFDARWKWLRSFGTWQAAQAVFLYPENFLLPELRHGQSQAFADFLEMLDQAGASESSVDQAAATYRAAAAKIWTVQFHPHATTATGLGLESFSNLQRTEYQSVGINDPARRYLDEWYFYLPLAVADHYNGVQAFERAQEWLSVVYFPHVATYPDDFPFRPIRLVWWGFSESRDRTYSYRNTTEWLSDPFAPFAIAAVRSGAFVRHVVMRLVENLLDWADLEFSRDTSESIGRARELYEQAESVLQVDEIVAEDDCRVRWRTLLESLATMLSVEQLRLVLTLVYPITLLSGRVKKSDIEKLRVALATDEPFEDRLQAVKQVADTVHVRPRPTKSVAEILLEQSQCQLDALTVEDEFHRAVGGSVTIETLDATNIAAGDVAVADRAASRIGCGFCVPSNPALTTLRYRISSNLDKIRTCRNYAGLRRSIRTYAPAVDPVKAVQVAAGGEDVDVAVPAEPPPVHRFSYLIERARYHAEVARQLESQLLGAFQQEDSEQYSLLKAKQDLRLSQQGVVLHDLRVGEASDGVTLAQQQRDRAVSQLSHFQDLLTEGLTKYEQEAIENLWKAHDWAIAAAVANTVSGVVSGAVSGASTGGGPLAAIAGAILGGAGAATQGVSTVSSLYSQARSMQASFERRQQEWELQVTLSTWDQQIGSQGILLANDRLQITQQEKEIARIQQGAAAEVVEFLGTKFTGVRLWQWMGRVLRRYYRDHINFATATARMAQRALEFERQEPLSFIASHYANSEHRDLLVAEQLLTDINKLDQHRLTTERRRKELTKTISLADLDPIEFARLRSEGWMSFVTPAEHFDRDFPGHYLRLIKNVTLTVVALVPPGEGVHATLSNNGVSRVIVGQPFDQPREITRQPESIAVTTSSNGTGLFELRLDDPILLPFEGAGVETTWTLEMPKGANRFDFDTLVDVLFTIRYTALEDRSYREKVLKQMGMTSNRKVSSSGRAPFPIRTSFADEWYDLHNPQFVASVNDYGFGPGQTKRPYLIRLEIGRRDLPPNEIDHTLSRINVAFRQQPPSAIPLEIVFRPEGSNNDYGWTGDYDWDAGDPTSGPVSIAAFSRTRSASAGWQVSNVPVGTLPPFGRWDVRIRNEDAPPALVDMQTSGQRVLRLDWLKDALFVITYDAALEYKFAP